LCGSMPLHILETEVHCRIQLEERERSMNV